MERAEAEAIYDAGRERCVEFIVELARRCEELAGRCERLEERVRRLEEQTRQSSRNSSAVLGSAEDASAAPGGGEGEGQGAGAGGC